MSLEELYREDRELFSLYLKKLLEPGWAGELDPMEIA